MRSAVFYVAAAAGAAAPRCAPAEQTLYRNAERATELVLNLDAAGAWYRSSDAKRSAASFFGL